MANEIVTAHQLKMKQICSSDSIAKRAESMLGKNAGTFIASVMDLYNTDSMLVQCDPVAVMQEAMKAAALHLPVAKSLGFAYVLPFKQRGQMVPTFIIGYKGLIQLAMRTGQYKTINADCIYEGETYTVDRLSGDAIITGMPTSDKVIGYFAHFQMLNGFTKTICWDRARVEAHAKRYSKSYGSEYSPWRTDFDSMACKTLLRQLLGKYGFMSVEYMTAVMNDADERTEQEIMSNANAEPISIPAEPTQLPVEPAPTQTVMDGFSETPDF